MLGPCFFAWFLVFSLASICLVTECTLRDLMKPIISKWICSNDKGGKFHCA